MPVDHDRHWVRVVLFCSIALLVKKNAFITYMEKQPQEAAIAVADGIQFADQLRNAAYYDRNWPASYGRLRMQCGIEGKCAAPEVLPEKEWPQAFQEAVARVTRYYRINKN